MERNFKVLGIAGMIQTFKEKEVEKMERNFKVLGIAVMMAIFLVASPALAKKKYEGKTFQIHLDITPNAKEQVLEDIAPKLKEKWGIDMQVEVSGVTGQIQKLMVQKNNPRFNIAGLDTALGVKAWNMGLLAPIDLEKAPVLKDLYDWAYIKEGDQLIGLGQYLTCIGLIYNEEVFKNRGLEPPTSWNDLWRKDLAGRVSITAPESTWGVAYIVAFAQVYGGSQDNINASFDKIKNLLPNIHTIHTWSSEFIKLLQLKEVWLGTTASHIGPALRAKGFPARWIMPKEGAPMSNGGIQIIANAPYPDVAYDFLKLYYSPEFQLRRVRESGIFSPNKKVWSMMSEEERKNSPINLKDIDRVIRLDVNLINKDRQAWIERWHREISK